MYPNAFAFEAVVVLPDWRKGAKAFVASEQHLLGAGGRVRTFDKRLDNQVVGNAV